MKVRINCTHCNPSWFEAEIPEEFDRLRVPDPPAGWSMYTDAQANVIRYTCPDCMEYLRRHNALLTLADFGRNWMNEKYTDSDL